MIYLDTIISKEDVKKSKKLCELIAGDIGLAYDTDGQLTIADIIDNAQFLFNIKIHEKSNLLNIPARTSQNRILRMCQQDKPIQEISQYILDSIK